MFHKSDNMQPQRRATQFRMVVPGSNINLDLVRTDVAKSIEEWRRKQGQQHLKSLQEGVHYTITVSIQCHVESAVETLTVTIRCIICSSVIILQKRIKLDSCTPFFILNWTRLYGTTTSQVHNLMALGSRH